MYSNNSNPGGFQSNGYELNKLVEGTDIFNSELLYKVTKYPSYSLRSMKVTTKSNTPSSIANEIYGNHLYSWIIILFNPELRLSRYNIGDTIYYPDLNEFNEYIRTAI